MQGPLHVDTGDQCAIKIDNRGKYHIISSFPKAGIAQLVEHNLAKVGVASSNLVSRSKDFKAAPSAAFLALINRGCVAEWLCSGLQSRLHRFDSGRSLQSIGWQIESL